MIRKNFFLNLIFSILLSNCTQEVLLPKACIHITQSREIESENSINTLFDEIVKIYPSLKEWAENSKSIMLKNFLDKKECFAFNNLSDYESYKIGNEEKFRFGTSVIVNEKLKFNDGIIFFTIDNNRNEIFYSIDGVSSRKKMSLNLPIKWENIKSIIEKDDTEKNRFNKFYETYCKKEETSQKYTISISIDTEPLNLSELTNVFEKIVKDTIESASRPQVEVLWMAYVHGDSIFSDVKAWKNSESLKNILAKIDVVLKFSNYENTIKLSTISDDIIYNKNKHWNMFGREGNFANLKQILENISKKH